MKNPATAAPGSGPKVAKRTAVTDAERALIERRYREGATIPQISDEVGRSWSVVGRHVKALGLSRPMGPPPKHPPPPTDATCRHCGGSITFSSPYYASGSRGQFCSRECFRAHVRTGAVVACPVCGKERYRAKCHLRKKCCDQCFARYRWHVSFANLRPLMRPLHHQRHGRAGRRASRPYRAGDPQDG